MHVSCCRKLVIYCFDTFVCVTNWSSLWRDVLNKSIPIPICKLMICCVFTACMCYHSCIQRCASSLTMAYSNTTAKAGVFITAMISSALWQAIVQWGLPLLWIKFEILKTLCSTAWQWSFCENYLKNNWWDKKSWIWPGLELSESKCTLIFQCATNLHCIS